MKTYGLVLAIILTLGFTSCSSNHGSKSILFSEFKKMLVEKDIERVVVVNEDKAKIYLKPKSIDKYQIIFGKDSFLSTNEGPQFEYMIGNLNTFENDFNELQNEFPDNELVYIEYLTEKNYFFNLLDWSLPIALLLAIFLPFIVWLILLINILKSQFVNSNDKLVWILIITFVPIIGLFLYIFIGKKQRTHNK